MAGFKLDTLLRLADVKGTDRRTSLLAFVTAALLARGQGDVGSLPQQLSSIRAAANLQVLAAAHRHLKGLGLHLVVATVGCSVCHHRFAGV
jgi:Formin Homology 2 Domain